MKSTFITTDQYMLEDQHVLLMPMDEGDYHNLLPFSLHEPELWKYSLVSGAGEEGLKHYMQLALDARDIGREYPFIVFDKNTASVAGCTRFYDINMPYQTLQLGYTWYGKQFQGTGINKRCKYLLLSFAFEDIGIERVEFRADNNNLRSIAAMKSIGCTAEGVLRSNMPRPDGGRRDSIVLSILKDEWFGSVKEMLREKIG